MYKGYMPKKLAEQVQWAQTFVTVVQPAYASYGLTEARILEFATVAADLFTAWTLTQNETTRTKVTISQRDALLTQMKTEARKLVSVIQGTPTVTEAMLIAAGLTVRKTTPTPKPAPTEKPIPVVTKLDGRIATVELRQAMDKRAKPKDVTGATIFIAYGDEAPIDASGWTFYAAVSKTTTTVDFGASETAGKAWITAFWMNAKNESGPAATPVAINLPVGGTLPREADQPVMLKAA